MVGCNNQTPTNEKSFVSKKTLKEEYELSERCGKRCDDLFRKDYGNGNLPSSDGHIICNYQNHYNKKLNKCFFLVTTTSISKNKKTNRVETLEMIYLFDVNDNKEYGRLIRWDNSKTQDCRVLEKYCKTEDEWDSLVKPYMEE